MITVTFTLIVLGTILKEALAVEPRIIGGKAVTRMMKNLSVT